PRRDLRPRYPPVGHHSCRNGLTPGPHHRYSHVHVSAFVGALPQAFPVGVKLGKLVVDVTPLRVSRDFRWLFAARVVSLLSVGLIGATVAMQMYSLTGSSLNVGLVSACLAVPMVVGLLVGGVLADRHDRRIL